MKKHFKSSSKILSILLAILMIFTAVPVVSFAEYSAPEDTISDEMCARHIEHETAFTFTEGEVPAGSYYLADDIALTGDLTITGEVHLCLNGKVLNINGDHSITVTGEDASLNIYDCQDTVHKFSDSEDGMSWVLDEENGDKEVAGGVITGADSLRKTYTGVITAINKATINICKANIIGNCRKSVGGNSSAISLIMSNGANVNIYSCNIFGNYLLNETVAVHIFCAVNNDKAFIGKKAVYRFNRVECLSTYISTIVNCYNNSYLEMYGCILNNTTPHLVASTLQSKMIVNGDIYNNNCEYAVYTYQGETTVNGTISDNTCLNILVYSNESKTTINGDIIGNECQKEIVYSLTGSDVYLNGKIIDNSAKSVLNVWKGSTAVIGEGFEMQDNIVAKGDMVIYTEENEGYSQCSITFETVPNDSIELSCYDYSTGVSIPSPGSNTVVYFAEGIDAEALLEKLKGPVGIEDIELDEDGNIICVPHVHKTETIGQLDATCTADGYTGDVVCAVCGAEISTGTAIDKIAHTASAPVSEITNDSTCSAEGSYDEVVYCSVCGDEISREAKTIEKKPHTEKTINAKAATCSEEGYTGDVVCAVCGEGISTGTAIDKIAHTASTPVSENIIPATCVAEGSYDEVVYCSVCGDEISREAKTLSVESDTHTPAEPIKINVVPSTCTQRGSYTEIVKCSVCGEELSRTQKTTPMLGHTYKSVVTEPTCTEQGYTTFTCKDCGDTYKGDYRDPIAHTYNDTIVVPTCKKGGYTKHTCVFCGDTYTDSYTDVKEHTYVRTVYEPTCTKGGYTKYTCSACGDVYIGDTVKAPGHDYTNIMTAATCTEGGNILHICKNCGNEYTEIIPLMGHKDDDGNGVCDRCGAESSHVDKNHDGDCDNCGKDLSGNKQCGCICHSDSGISQFFYQIAKFFWRLFGTNKTCECGKAHY